MTLSIIINNYNNRAGLQRTIDSVPTCARPLGEQSETLATKGTQE